MGKLSKLPKKCFHFTVELFNLAKARDFPSDETFTCQGKLGEFEDVKGIRLAEQKLEVWGK